MRLVLAVAVAVLACCLSFAAARSAATNRPPASAAPPAAVEEDPVEVALSTVELLGSEAVYDGRARPSLLGGRLTPALRAEVDAGFAQAAAALGLSSDGSSDVGELVARLVPVGHHVVERQPARAVVAVWTVGLLGVAGPVSPEPVQATWSTETLELELVDGQWTCTAITRTDGPAPVGGAQVPAAPSELLEQDKLFTGAG